VNHEHEYIQYAKRDFRELKPGKGGNCAAIAYTKKLELERYGISATVMLCRLQDGQGHTFLVTNAGVLDCRFDQVVSCAEVGCEK
jgi:predicted transglutaminase-like cysteine proteinase